MEELKSINLEVYSSPEDLLLTLADRLRVNELVARIIDPTEKEKLSDVKVLRDITPLVYEIWNQKKIWIIAALAAHVKNISWTRRYWREIDDICEDFKIDRTELSEIQILKKES